MDLTKLTDADLMALKSGDLSKVSDAGLMAIKGGGTPMDKSTKIMRGVIDPVEGAAQLLTHILPESVVNAGNKANNWLADKTGMVAKIPDAGFDALVAGKNREYESQRAAAGESGFDGYRMLGNVVSPANAVLAARLPLAATLAGRIGMGAVGGGVSALSAPVVDGDFWSEKGKQVATGAAFGGAMAPVVGAVARVVSPKASTNPNLQLLKDEGVRPTVGQTAGGWANALEEKAQSLPIMGDAITAARNRAREQFNTAAINRASGKVGERVEGSGQAAIAEAGDKISAVYDRAKQMMGGFQVDQQAASELATLSQMVRQLPNKERRAFDQVEAIYKQYLSPNGTMTAESFKQLDSKLGLEAGKFSGSSDAYQKQLGDALKEFQRVIVENAKRANPAAADLMAKADAAWANLVRVEGASVAAKGTGGVFTPGQLNTAVRQADASTRDRATARGTALMQDLSNAGQQVLGNKVQDSGTTGRLLMAGGALSSGVLNPAIPASLLAGAAAYSPPAQALLRGLLSARPNEAQAIAEALRKSAPALSPGGAQVGLGLLN